MVRLDLLMTLRADVVMSASSATLGSHRTLAHLPGSAVLGAVAARSWSQLGDAVAWRLFESGAVRFGNALPVGADGVRSMPTPASLHVEKSRAHAARHENHAVLERRTALQFQQARGGFVVPSASGDGASCTRLAPRTRYTLRTAVGAEGRARDGYLYGYEAIEVGQVFRGWVEADDARDLELVRPWLDGRTLHLGRSRSAEFAAVDVEVLDPAGLPAAFEPVAPAQRAGGRLVALCVSDVSLVDGRTGGPRLLPEPGDLGLGDGWELDAGRSFLRFRTWSPWNGHRRRPGIERQCIAAGSVIVFRPTSDAAPEPGSVSDGVGLWRSRGLGEVLIDPALLHGDHVELRDGPGDGASGGPLPQDELGVWLTRRWAAEVRTRRLEATVDDAAEAMAAFGPVGPSQWGEVARLAAVSAPSALVARLEEHVGLAEPPGGRSRGAHRGATARRWSARAGGRTAAQALAALVKAQAAEDGKEFLRLLAKRRAGAERRARAEKSRSEGRTEG